MLRILGGKKTLCNGLSRRDLLQVGSLGMFGFGLSDLFKLQATASASTDGSEIAASFGKAKRCILLYLFGSPSQLETFDPKPDAPAEIQGELKAIQTNLPGVQIGEGLPQIAKIMDRLTVVRSLSHNFPLHGVTYAVSGVPTVDATVEAAPRDPRLWPFIGSVVDYIEEQRAGGVVPPVPRNIAMPWLFYSKCNFRPIGGPYATFLGAQHDPIWTDFSAQGTTLSQKVDDRQVGDLYDPYQSIDPKAKIELSGAAQLQEGMTVGRFQSRRELLSQIDNISRKLDANESSHTYDRFRNRAYSLLTSAKVRQALDLERETLAMRERYGMTLFGQASLTARRLMEAGSKFVTVFWDAVGYNTGGWDTHVYHYPRLKTVLLPGFDQTFSALILDLESRGMLDDTLVLCLSEHGRAPKITETQGGGRDHWSRAYSAVLAGGGVPRGSVAGRTDKTASEVITTPFSPKDILATAFHLLGIDPHTMITDRMNRPVPISGTGQVRPELLA